MRELKFRAQDTLGNWIYFTLRNMYPIKMEYYRNEGQYTGLKDENGNEIYEGDILKTNEHIDAVVWREDLCGFSYLKDQSRLNLVDWLDNGKYSGTIVIGNVYDNPELLKV